MTNISERPTSGFEALAELGDSVRRALASDPELRAFLLARVAERRAEVRATYPEGYARQGVEIGLLHRAFMAGFPVASQKAQAEQFADHPDYREEWKP